MKEIKGFNRIVSMLREELDKVYFEFTPININDVANTEDETRIVRVKFRDIEEKYNFINIMEDFYCVESINKIEGAEYNEDMKQHIAAVRKKTKIHGNLLRLALFYYIELDKCIKAFDNVNWKIYEFQLPIFFSIESMIEYLITKLNDNEYILERFFVLNILYGIITKYPSHYLWNRVHYWDYIGYFYGNINEYTKIIEKLLDLFKYINQYFNKQIKIQQNNILHLVSKEDSNDFGDLLGIGTLGDKLEELLTKHELISNGYIKGKFNCYATLSSENEQYFTINGVDDDTYTSEDIIQNKLDISNIEKESREKKRKETIKILMRLLEDKLKNIEYIGITDETRYYFEKLEDKYITYIDFKSNNCKNSRMFSCCERKLLAKVRSKLSSGEKMQMTIAKKPCEICQREIDLYKANIEIKNTSSKSKLDKDDLQKMDTCAKEIFGTM